MSARTVTDYRALWDTKSHRGRIAIRLQGGKTQTIKIDDYAEFVAILAVLQGENAGAAKPLFLDTAP